MAYWTRWAVAICGRCPPLAPWHLCCRAGGEEAHLRFLRQGVDTWLGWAGGFVSTLGFTGLKALQALESTLGPWQGGMSQLATFPDAFTDTYQHTGVQAIARRLMERAAAEIEGDGDGRGDGQGGREGGRPLQPVGSYWRSSSEIEKITALGLEVACRSCRKERRQYTRCSQRGPP